MKQLSSPVLQTRLVRHFVRSAAYLAACASVLVVAGCGGGEEGAATEAAALEPASGLADRQFALWAPGAKASARAAGPGAAPPRSPLQALQRESARLRKLVAELRLRLAAVR